MWVRGWAGGRLLQSLQSLPCPGRTGDRLSNAEKPSTPPGTDFHPAKVMAWPQDATFSRWVPGQQRSARFFTASPGRLRWLAGLRGPAEDTETDASHSAKSLSQQTGLETSTQEAGAARALCPCLPGSCLEAAISGTLKRASPEAVSLSRLPLPRRTSPGIRLCPGI